MTSQHLMCLVSSNLCRDVGKRPLLEGSDSEADSVNSSVGPSPRGDTRTGGAVGGRPSNGGSGGSPSPSGPWRLVITGHSLGAGIAAFAGLFLHTLYPGVRVFCYSPPAWMMTPELSKFSERFVTSVVINKDLFSRYAFVMFCGMCRCSTAVRVHPCASTCTLHACFSIYQMDRKAGKAFQKAASCAHAKVLDNQECEIEQEPHKDKTGWLPRSIHIHSNCTRAPSQKSFPAHAEVGYLQILGNGSFICPRHIAK